MGFEKKDRSRIIRRSTFNKPSIESRHYHYCCRHATSEILKFADESDEGRRYTPENFKSIALICDHHDEVNIAQFHVTPGNYGGIIYGTKKGRVRMFTKC